MRDLKRYLVTVEQISSVQLPIYAKSQEEAEKAALQIDLEYEPEHEMDLSTVCCTRSEKDARFNAMFDIALVDFGVPFFAKEFIDG